MRKPQAARAARGQRHFLVRRENCQSAGLEMCAEVRRESFDGFRIECGKWFIQDPERLRMREPQTRQRCAPPLALRQMTHRQFTSIREAAACERRIDVRG